MSEWWLDPKSDYYKPTHIPKHTVIDLTKKPKGSTADKYKLRANIGLKHVVIGDTTWIPTPQEQVYITQFNVHDPITPHKLGFFENIINKLKRGKNGK